MRRFFVVLLCAILLVGSIHPCSATEEQVIYSTEEFWDGDVRVVEVIYLSVDSTYATDKTYTRQREYYYGDTLIADIAITGTFRYTGSSVSVVSKSVSRSETYDGWSFKQSSFSSSGGTIALTGKLTKLLIFNADVNMSLTCDKNGNIS